MTNEEAKKQLKQLKAFTGYDKLHEALDMAIKALEDTTQMQSNEILSKKEKIQIIMEQEEFAFLKNIPEEQLWKLFFALSFILEEE